MTQRSISVIRCGIFLAQLAAAQPLFAAATFTRIIGMGDSMPDMSETVKMVSRPVIDEGSPGKPVLLVLGTGYDHSSFHALYRVDSAGTFQRVVSSETPKPGGGTLGPITLYSAHQGKIYFIASFGDMIGKVDQAGGEVTLIAAKDGVSSGSDKFMQFSSVSAHAGGVVFEAAISRNANITYQDLFYYGGSTVVSLMGYGVNAVPGVTGIQFAQSAWVPLNPVLKDGEAIFSGGGISFTGIGSVQGIYALPVPGSGKTARMIVDSNTKLPGSVEVFRFIGSPLLGDAIPFDVDAGEVVFYGNSYSSAGRGLYRNSSTGGTLLAADGRTPIPGSEGYFKVSSFAESPISVSGGRMVFRAADTNFNTSIFLQDGPTIEKIVGPGDEIGGVQVGGFELTREGFSGNQLVFSANSIAWRATLGQSTPAVFLRIARNGVSWELSWDSAAAGQAAVLESTDSLSTPNWQPVSNSANPFLVQAEGAGSRFYRLRL